MFVVGRVLDPQGKPVPNASVMVYARSMIFRPATSAERSYPKELGRASSDVSGRFRVDVPRTSSSRHDEFGAVALAPGYGVGLGRCSTPTPISPPPTSHFGPSR